MTSGLHHITAITRKIQANVDFYVGFLGLRLVKRTAGFEDAAQLHLFYGDARATPGSLVSFLAWEDGSPGRVGHGAPSEIAFAIPREAMGFWLTRALQFGIATTGPALEFGEPVIRIADPDGIIVKLVGMDELQANALWTSRGIEAHDAIIRLRGATILSEKPGETEDFLTRFAGFARAGSEGTIMRFVSDAHDVIDIRDAAGFWPAAPGTGTIDHVAVRMTDRAAVDDAARQLSDGDHGDIAVHDRNYFYSLYVREPAGTLIELASDGPGFSTDEPFEHLGETLFIPAHFKADDRDIIPVLPQFGLPGEPRIVYRDLPFVHRIHEAEAPGGSTWLLLHGTGGSETSLLPMARKLAPDANLIGIRGRSTEEGVARFFRRYPDGTFDQKDIVAEATALSAFVEEAISVYGRDQSRLVFAGYSNGANMLAAAMLLDPQIARQAILLRPMAVLEQAPQSNLAGLRVLLVSGERDPYGPHAEVLANQLRTAGAEVSHVVIPAGHELSDGDDQAIRDWLAAASATA